MREKNHNSTNNNKYQNITNNNNYDIHEDMSKEK